MTNLPPAVPSAIGIGLHCPQCEYNLTGLPGCVCPECGWEIDWQAAYEAVSAVLGRDQTEWQTCRWPLKLVGFVSTMFTAGVMPWRLARQIPDLPFLLMPLCFAGVCLLSPLAMCRLGVHENALTIGLWIASATICLFVQSVILGCLFPVSRRRNSIRFWIAACSYGSFVIPLEVSTEAMPLILATDSSIWAAPGRWPFTMSILFCLWCIDLLVIAGVRSRRRSWWRFVLAGLSLPLLTVALSWGAIYVAFRTR